MAGNSAQSILGLTEDGGSYIYGNTAARLSSTNRTTISAVTAESNIPPRISSTGRTSADFLANKVEDPMGINYTTWWDDSRNS